MNGIYLVIVAACVLLLAYRYYGAFIAAKVLTLDQYRATPAMIRDDGTDYVPTNKWIIFGQHFAAITGTGPIVGPVIAAQFGYMPGLIWILIGATFAGAVHDMVILFASVRYEGKSIGHIAKEELGSMAGLGVLLLALFLLVITLASLGLIIAHALTDSPWGFFAVAMTIPIALFMGVYNRYIRPGKIAEVTILGVVLILVSIALGPYIAENPHLVGYFTYNLHQVEIMLVIYGFFTAALPIWFLMTPHGYVSTYLKLGMFCVLTLAIMLVMPMIRMPSVTSYISGGGPLYSGPIFPYIFITVVCGSISGFHALVSTGTTPKMITNEKEILPIGYGAMLVEAFIAIMALIAVTSLHPADYFAINFSVAEYAKLHVTTKDLPQLAVMVGEQLRNRPGGAVSLAVGMANIFSQIPGLKVFLSYWYHFFIVFEVLFVLTIIDAGSLVGRYLVQEMLGKVYKPFAKANSKIVIYGASLIISVLWGYLLVEGDIFRLWYLFGVSNQLLATITLAIGTALILRLGRRRYAWITGIPAVFMAVITVDASYENIMYQYLPYERYLLAFISIVMLLLAVYIFVKIAYSWYHLYSGAQDYRNDAQVELDTLKDAKQEK